jgi:hypothetical protein
MASPRKTTASTAAPAETPYDFDNWTEEDEAKAILAAVPDVRHIVVERRFIGRFADGDIVEVPLTLSLDDVDELQADYPTPVDQFKAILRTLGGDEAAAKFTAHDLIETAIMAEKYFRTLGKVQQAAFPES